MAYCPECGFQIERTDVFCGSCGYKLSGDDFLQTFVASPGFDLEFLGEKEEKPSAEPSAEPIESPMTATETPVEIEESATVTPVSSELQPAEIPATDEAVIPAVLPESAELLPESAPKRQTGELSFNKTSANFAVDTLDNFGVNNDSAEAHKTFENVAVSTDEKLDVAPVNMPVFEEPQEEFKPAPLPVIEPIVPISENKQDDDFAVSESAPPVEESGLSPLEMIFARRNEQVETNPEPIEEEKILSSDEDLQSEIKRQIAEAEREEAEKKALLEAQKAGTESRELLKEQTEQSPVYEPPTATPIFEESPKPFEAEKVSMPNIGEQIRHEADKISTIEAPDFEENPLSEPKEEKPVNVGLGKENFGVKEADFPPIFQPEPEKSPFGEAVPPSFGTPPENPFIGKQSETVTPPVVPFETPKKVAEPVTFTPPVPPEMPISVETPVTENKPLIVAQDQVPDEDRRGTTVSNKGGTQGEGKAAKLKPLEDGTLLIGRYEIQRRIGGGGMGAVYLAQDKNLGNRLRAVKEMIQAYVDDEQQEKALNDFRRESLLLSELEHPSIPTIYDYFFDDKTGRFYLVMKYIAGGDLSSRLRSTPSGRLDELFITEMAVQVADVLSYLHLQKTPIIYRDLKPSNIMIDNNSGRAMLIDFGIARSVAKEEKGVTAVGTMGYAPPELFSGNADQRTDIYSLGATMFHLLTGADPQNNPLLIFDFTKNPRPRQLNQSLSVEIEKILMRAVEYNPDLRFQSAAEMRDALLTHAQNLRGGRVTYTTESTIAVASVSSQMPQSVFCGFCGAKILATDLFCAYCGTRQAEAEKYIAAMQQPSDAPARPTARLVIAGTNELDPPSYNLEKDENLLGRRDPQSNIFPEIDLTRYDPSIKISRRHARIWKQGTTFLIEDLGSSNGTLVLLGGNLADSKRLLPHQPHALANGDKVKLGETTLHFFVG